MSNQASLGDIADSDNSTRAESKEDSTHDSYLQLGPDTLDIPESWGKTEFADTFSHQRGVNYSGDNYVEEGEGMIFLTLNAIAPGGGLKKDSLKYYEDEISEKRKVKPGDILMANTDLNQEGEIVGYPVKVPDFESDQEICFSHHLLKIEQKEEKFNEQFLEYLFSSNYIHSRMIAFSCGSTVLNLNTSLLEKLELPVPEKDEQRRIASVLYNVDQAISKTEEIIEQTQRVKKGLMQDLFTEGYYSHEEFEEHPLLGERPASWSVETVGDLTKKVQYGLSEALQEEGEYPIFRMNNYENGYMRDHPMKYIDLSEEEFQKYKVEKGDILFNRTNSHELVGKTGIFELEDDYVFASYLVRLRTNEKVDPYYLNFFMNSEEGQNRLKTFATKGVSQSNINASSVQKLKVPVPDKKEEQKKIVEVIKNLDKKIEWNKEYLEDLKSLKKGLMQDLLTGSVRTGEDVRVLDEVVEVEG